MDQEGMVIGWDKMKFEERGSCKEKDGRKGLKVKGE